MELEVAYQRCLDRLVRSIEELAAPPPISQLEPIASLIVQTMTGQWRYFHTPSHIFEVGGSDDPIEVLAALFHDLVYVQVDSGINLNVSRYISSYIKEVDGQLVILDDADLPDDREFAIVKCVFGFRGGQVLEPFRGQNEFLSAAIATRALSPFLPHTVLVQIAACIEATIPFRPVSPDGRTASEQLEQQIVQANRQFDLGWTPAEIYQIVKRAVRLANRDVENFALPSSAEFLDNTWNLLPETNHDLISANSYTVRGYRRSIQKMEGFINFLKAELVFAQYRGEPDDETYSELIKHTRKNLDTAKLYLGIKLITIAVLEALSYRLGRNVHISTMMGEFPEPGVITPALEQFLPAISIEHPPRTVLEAEVLELLSKGRTRESAYDLKNSPVATFIIQAVGFECVTDLLAASKAFLAGELPPEEFLKHRLLRDGHVDIVETITRGVLQLLKSRAKTLEFVPVDYGVSASTLWA
ncbi:MAG: hypothetical protein J7641_22050 [Cyanobacteria bacterium SID2]|nr:hypothetical protein [Cyanobacteria bacterium SID2]MBP0004536.1 hypothetical protein [Cyanobacteria bacterium SBC]